MITAVLTADNHIGTYYSRLRPDRLHQRRERLQRGFAQTVDVAVARRAQLFLIAGDLFDRPDPRNADRAFVAAQLARLRRAGVAVVAVCGNHDSPRMLAYDGGTVPLQEMEALDGLHLLRDDACWSAVELTVTGTGGKPTAVRVRGASYSFAQEADCCPLAAWAEGLTTPDSRTAPVEITLLHYPVEGWETPHASEPTLTIANLERITADLIGVGHLHVRNRRRLSSGALVVNPGATERIHFGEESHTSGCYVVTLEPGRPAEAEYVATEHQPMVTVDVTAKEILAAIGEGEPGDAVRYLEDRVTGVLESLGTSAPDALLRIRLEGILPETVFNAIDVNELRSWAQQRCFHAEVVLDDVTIRYQDMEIALGSGGFEIDREMEAVVDAMLAQIEPERCDTPAERRDAERKRQAIQSARETLLSAYQRLKVG